MFHNRIKPVDRNPTQINTNPSDLPKNIKHTKDFCNKAKNNFETEPSKTGIKEIFKKLLYFIKNYKLTKQFKQEYKHLIKAFIYSEHEQFDKTFERFIEIIKNNDPEKTDKIIAKMNFNIMNYNGETLFSKACRVNNVPLIKILLKNDKIDFNKELAGNYNRTAFTLSVMNKNIKVVNELLNNKNVHLNAVDKNGETALILAVKNWSPAMVRKLLTSKRVDPDIFNNQSNTPLMIAAQLGSPKMTRELLKRAKNINHHNLQGQTALILAVIGGKHEVVHALLKSDKLDVGFVDNNGKTALMLATEGGYHDIVDMLLKSQGADVNARNKNANAALF